jgi:uncharacterized protein YjiS (DUF1127 family)
MQRPILSFVSLRERKFSFKGLIVALFSRRNSACSRLHLLDLNDRMLRDIGLTRLELLHGVDFRSDAGRERE